MKVIFYYTKNTPYEEQAKRLIESLEFYQQDYTGYVTNSSGTWEKNCAQKSRVIERALEETEHDIFYVDADSEFVREPDWSEFEGLNIPAFIRFLHRDADSVVRSELISNSMFFPNNSLSRRIVQSWIKTQDKNPETWDQVTLQAVIDQNNVNYKTLSYEWGAIDYFNIRNPIINQYQASRKLKKEINGE